MHRLKFKAFLKAWVLSQAIYKEQPFLFLWKNKLRFSIISLLSAPDSAEWFAQLAATDWIRPLLEKMPVLTFKPMRTYLAVDWGFGRRKKVIWDTYELIRRYPLLWDTLLTPGGRSLASYQAEGLSRLGIVLCDCHHSTSKEGELMVVLRSYGPDHDILKMTFSFEHLANGAFNCYIGCIQGGGGDNREEIKAITKAMHGLRPTSLMIFAVREIIAAMEINVVALMGSGNCIHPYRKKHLIHLPSVHRISFNYDTVWEEADGVAGDDGWFRLPVNQERRESGEIKSKKRALYQRRYAMMDDLSRQIRMAVRGEGQ